MTQLETYITENENRFLEDLKSWLRIPSISTLPEHAGDIGSRHPANPLCSSMGIMMSSQLIPSNFGIRHHLSQQCAGIICTAVVPAMTKVRQCSY